MNFLAGPVLSKIAQTLCFPSQTNSRTTSESYFPKIDLRERGPFEFPSSVFMRLVSSARGRVVYCIIEVITATCGAYRDIQKNRNLYLGDHSHGDWISTMLDYFSDLCLSLFWELLIFHHFQTSY